VLLKLMMAGVVTGSSAQLEGLGVLKLTDNVIYGRLVWSRLGGDVSAPTFVLSDAEAALRHASGNSSAARLRVAIRQSAIVTLRVRASDVALAHVPDSVNVVDMFTKWVSADKVERSLAWLTGSASRAAHSAEMPPATMNVMATSAFSRFARMGGVLSLVDAVESGWGLEDEPYSEA